MFVIFLRVFFSAVLVLALVLVFLLIYVKTKSSFFLQLMKWADVMLIFPLDANTMAKLANGISDNLLVSFQANTIFLGVITSIVTVMYSEPHQTSKMERFAKIVDGI